MKSLIISIVSITSLVTGWLIFVNYADEHLHNQMNRIEDQIIVSIENGNWEEASRSFEELSEQWHKDKKVYSFFLDSQAVVNADYSIARAKSYISAKDLALAKGELSCIKEQLGFLHLNELVTLENVL